MYSAGKMQHRLLDQRVLFLDNSTRAHYDEITVLTYIIIKHNIGIDRLYTEIGKVTG